MTTCAASEHKNRTISATLLTSQKSSPFIPGSDVVTYVSTANIRKSSCTRYRHTVLRQHPQAFHVDTARPGRLENVGSHRAGSNNIAANTLGGVECAGVLRQTDQAVLACGVRGACDGGSVCIRGRPGLTRGHRADIPEVNPLTPAIEAMLTMLPFFSSFSHCLMARPLTIAGAVRFKAMTLSQVCLSYRVEATSQLLFYTSTTWSVAPTLLPSRPPHRIYRFDQRS